MSGAGAVAVTPLNFRCTSCGNCCRNLRVAVTALDVERLAQGSGHPASELVEWLGPDAVDMTGEPQSFVELAEGRRLMVLRQVAGACRLLGTDNRCGAYAARPRDCRAFPFDFSAPAAAPPERRLTLLPLEQCDFATDNRNDSVALATEDAARWAELRDYQACVEAWNRRAWHRRRLHKSVGGAAQFLDMALATARASAELPATVNEDD